MAKFEGTIKEFSKFLGAYARIKVMHIAAKYKNKLGKCEECGSLKSLHAAHIRGKERPLLIANILSEFIENDIIKIDLNEFEERFVAAHQPIESTIRILCKDCHRKYDKIESEEEDVKVKSVIDESIVIEKLVNDQMNKSKAIKLAATKITSLSNSNTIFSNINAAQNIWWLEPNNNKFRNDLFIILNNDKDRELYYFKLPANTISNPNNHFIQRNDKVKTNCSDIYIPFTQTKFTDKRGFGFTRYLIETIEY